MADSIEHRLAAVFFADIVDYSRLTAHHPEEAIAAAERLQSASHEAVESHDGRVVKFLGDGVMAEFRSAASAVQAADDLRKGFRESAGPAAAAPEALRIGIHLGEIAISKDGDVYGEGVNVAARIQAAAEPGQILVSEDVWRQLHARRGYDFSSAGQRRLKGVEESVSLYAVDVHLPAGPSTGRAPSRASAAQLPEQQIRFTTAVDGVRIAYAISGDGPPLVKTANWLNHLEFDWRSPVWVHLMRELSRGHRLIRYDERGNGLSDWDVEDLSFDAFVRDLESVVEAAGLERFALLGISQGCPISIAYAVRYPEKITRMVLHGGYAVGWRLRPEDSIWREGLVEMIRTGWGRDNDAFRRVFASLYIPRGTPEQHRWWTELQKMTTSPENAVRLLETVGTIDVWSLLPKVAVPTLVTHSRGDAGVPFDAGRALAARIPGARFLPLDSDNHLILEQEPAWPVWVAAVRGFLAENGDEAQR